MLSLSISWSMKSRSVLLVLLWHPFNSSENSLQLINELQIFYLICVVSIFHITVSVLWVYSFFGRFLFGCLFGFGWLFLWSSTFVSLFLQSIYSFPLSVSRGWKWFFLNQKPYITSLSFSNLVFFECYSEGIEIYFRPRAFFESLKIFFRVVYPFRFSSMLSPFPYFAPKSFCFLCIQLLVHLRVFFTYLQVEFSFVVLGYPVLLLLFYSFVRFYTSFSWWLSIEWQQVS